MVVDTAKSSPRTWVLDGRRRLVLRRPAEVMGIINATPDSFSDGGAHLAAADAIAAGERMVAAGAAWLDIGGESSRPGAQMIPADVELGRVHPVIAGLRERLPTVAISVDTCKARVARAALSAGADLVNDISAGGDPGMFAVVAAARCPIVLMHMQGTPESMQREPRYVDVVDEVEAFLAGRMKAAVASGIPESLLVLDPGIGFGKAIEHNLRLIAALPRLGEALGRPLLVGVSRKSFIATIARVGAAAERDPASHVLHGLIAEHCSLLRAHDVPGAVAACALAAAVRGAGDV
jgi:dihydropteroate synthase